MRWILVALILSVGLTPAYARTRSSLTDRFGEANTTHDGHLTAEQARSGMPAVARDFAAIDMGHRGFVTLDDIKAYRHTRRLERRAAKQAAQGGAQPASARTGAGLPAAGAE